MQANSLADLRARRAELNARLARGRDALRAKEDASDTGPEYERWLQAWLGLLAEYQIVCDQIAACRAQAARPGPTSTASRPDGSPTPPAPAATPAPPRQLNLFAAAACTAYTSGR